MESINRVAKNSLIIMASEVINKILSLILSIALARYLGDSGFGQFSFIVTMMMLFQVLADFGLEGLTIREIAKNIEKTQIYLRNVLALRFGIGLISFILLVIMINLMHKPTIIVYSVYLAGISIIFYSIANTFNAVFNAHERLDLKALLSILTRILVFGLTIWAILLRQSLIVLALIILISELFRAILSFLVCTKKIATLQFKLDLLLCKKLLSTSVPFALISIIALVYFKIDIIMLSLMKGDKIVGWYSAAYNLLAALLFITDAYALSIFPVMSRSADSSQKLLEFTWQRSVKYLLIVSLPIAMGTSILADRIILLFYPASFSASIIALKILIWTLPWIFVNAINMRVLYATDRQKEAMVVALLSMLLNILFNLILIPKLSYIGASLSTFLVEVINVSIYFLLVLKLLNLKLKIKKLLPKPLLAAIIMGAFIFYLKFLNLAVLITAGAFSYAVLLFVLRVFDEEDKRLMRKLIPAIGLKNNG